MPVSSQIQRNDYMATIRPSGSGAVRNLSPHTLSLMRSMVERRRITGNSQRSNPAQHASHLARMQQSVVKVSYIKNGYAGQWKAHGKYLEREGAQQEGERGTGFGSGGQSVSVSETIEQWQNAGDRHLFKLIVSPEQAGRLDMRDHVNALMARMERDLGTKLQWVAMDHHNTDNPHVHIALRGKDHQGKDLVIPKEYIRSGIRQRSQEEATKVLGRRTQQDIDLAREKNLQAKRITELDRELDKRKDAAGKVVISAIGTETQRNTDRQLLSRLQFLREIGLAKKTGSLTWQMQEGLLPALRQYQTSQDIVKRRAQHMSHIMDTRSPLKVTSWQELKESSQPITGRLVGLGLEDALKDGRYIMIEATDGRVHYVPVPRNVNQKLDHKELRAGELISLRPRSFVKESQTSKGHVADGNNLTERKTIHYVAIETSGTWKSTNAVPLDYQLVAQLRAGNPPTVQGSTLNAFQRHYNQLVEQRLSFLQQQGVVQQGGGINEKAWEHFRQAEHPNVKQHDADKDRGR
jgi:type IV secretory pathway VirD2 relaxase